MTGAEQSLAITSVICAGGFYTGRYFSRVTEVADLPVIASLGIFSDPEEMVRRCRLAGRFAMIFVTLFWLISTAILFGLLGPVDGIEPIRLGGGAS